MSHENSERDYKDPLRRNNPATSVILAGYRPRLSEYSVKVLLFRTSTFKFESAEEGAKFFERAYHLPGDDGEDPGLVYSRLNNPNTELVVEDGKVVHAGDILAKIPRELAKNKDITGGLPRVAELFEARIPKDQGIISEIDGIVEFDTDIKKKQRIRIRPEDEKGEVKEYLIPRGRHVTVHMGEYVRAGDPLIDEIGRASCRERV